MTLYCTLAMFKVCTLYNCTCIYYLSIHFTKAVAKHKHHFNSIKMHLKYEALEYVGGGGWGRYTGEGSYSLRQVAPLSVIKVHGISARRRCYSRKESSPPDDSAVGVKASKQVASCLRKNYSEPPPGGSTVWMRVWAWQVVLLSMWKSPTGGSAIDVKVSHRWLWCRCESLRQVALLAI